MSVADLNELHAGLPTPTTVGEHSFSATPIAVGSLHRIAKDHKGRAYLLIATRPATDGETYPNVRLENLVVKFDTTCVVESSDPKHDQQFTIIGCASSDQALREHFLRIMGPACAAIGNIPSTGDVYSAISRLVDMFRALSSPSRNTVQGIWAELVLITGARDPNRLVAAWHVEGTDLFDFSDGPERIEVKSTRGSGRRHHFALEQLDPPLEATVLVASLKVQTAGSGSSVQDLCDRVRPSLTPIHAVKLDEQVALALGDQWREAIAARFDEEQARSSLRYFSATDIPSIREPFSPAISDVKLVVDLSAVPPSDVSRTNGPLFSSLPPAGR